MKAKASAIGTPSGERYMRAVSNRAVGEVSCLARRPFRFAGERRKILLAIEGGIVSIPFPVGGGVSGILGGYEKARFDAHRRARALLHGGAEIPLPRPRGAGRSRGHPLA